MLRHITGVLAVMVFTTAGPIVSAADSTPSLKLDEGDRIVIIGNTLAERMQYFNRFETRLHARFPEKKLVVRNLGFSADTVNLRLRSQDFHEHGHTLYDHEPDVILAFFGFNESFAGPDGVDQFKTDLKNLVEQVRQYQYPYTNFRRGSDKPNVIDGKGKAPAEAPQIVLVSPIAQQDLHSRTLSDGKANNENLALYTDAMREVAQDLHVKFVDVFAPTKTLFASTKDALTINGVHLNDEGYAELAPILDKELFGDWPKDALAKDKWDALHAAVAEKSLQFFYDYRAINGFYIYGGRKKPFGVVNFPDEFAKLRKMIRNRDERIWAIAQGKDVPAEIDDSNTGDLKTIATNFPNEVRVTPPDEAIEAFKLPKGYEINLFASEEDFPELENPVQMAFDSKGRLWVTTMGSYPMYLPGTPVDDKILILEDTDGDGRADKQTVFADGLHVPTGIELGHGGAYVAQQPNIVFLKDTDGDDHADVREYRLHGFDSGDSHHAISAFTWGPGGALYFQEGTFHHSQVETPYGPVRLANAGVFRYEPLTEKLDAFIAYNFANPWGHTFDRWGQNFVADASGGANYFGTAFSGQVDFPRQHRGMNQFLVKQWRPTSGCELVSSSNFPKEAQGNYLLNNVIGFHGVLQYKMFEDESGFKAEPVEPLLRSADPNFRPVDLEFGPDGALYLIDWFNPLIGHMQHSLRDPKRDKNHGRVWRIRYTENPLVKTPNLADASIPELFELLASYEDRTRYRVRRELWSRDVEQVMEAGRKWFAGLDQSADNYEHLRLEWLWLHQAVDMVNVDLLNSVLTAEEPKARAAATRVLGYWRDRVPEPLELLRAQINDEHPRVRLEAVRALSFFTGEQAETALEVAVESLIYPQDYYLEYTLKETMDTLEARTE